MRQVTTSLIIVAALALTGAAVASAGGGHGERSGANDHGEHGTHGRFVVATLKNAAGERVGRVWLHQRGGHRGVEIVAHVRGLPAGFHGFHIHTTGRCDPPGFTTAGAHFNPAGASHNAHAGDLPSLLVNADGTASLATTTDRFTIAALRDTDGSAVIVHSGPDNYANIPPRYGTPDQETLNTGDSGSRLACGIIR